MRTLIRALNLANGIIYRFRPDTRCGWNPTHMSAPPNFTDETAFGADRGVLADAHVDSFVFIEWPHDRLYARNSDGNYIVGPTVWRLSRILGTVDVLD